MRATRALVALVASVALPSGCGKSATRTSTDGAANVDVPTSTGGVVGGGGGTATGGAGGGQTPDASVVGDAPSRTGGAGGVSATTASGGSSGAGGLTSTGGAGVTSTGGAGVTSTGGAGATSTGGATRGGGAGGNTAGAGGSAAGGATGSGGASATMDGGASPSDGGGSSRDGGVSNCYVIDALDRSCTTDADCIAVQHTSNCCGQLRYIGLRATESATFAANEPGCRASYPKCGCGVMPPTMDDGSMDNRQPAQVGVTCLAGTCTTFMLDCGKPCAAGTTCFSCLNNSQPYAVCTTQCLNPSSSSTECPNPAFPVCQRGLAGSLAGTFCTAAGVACNSK